MVPHYRIPRRLDTADRLAPGVTTEQAVWTIAGLLAAWLAWQLLSLLPAPATPYLDLRAWPPPFLALFGAIAKRRFWRGWDGLYLARALAHYAWRPKRCVLTHEEHF